MQIHTSRRGEKMGKPLSSAHQIVCSCGFMSSDMCVYQRILFVPQRFCVCVCLIFCLSILLAPFLRTSLSIFLCLFIFIFVIFYLHFPNRIHRVSHTTYSFSFYGFGRRALPFSLCTVWHCSNIISCRWMELILFAITLDEQTECELFIKHI